MKSWPNLRCAAACALAMLLTLAPAALADRTRLKPGMNSYSPQQDVAMGKKFAAEISKQQPLCNAPKVDEYLTKLGMRLVDHLNTFGNQYPWEFHCVNDKAINAFALPGGFVFINRGAIEAADYEAELAAVMAHELSHVALRHGTNQATKAQYAQIGSGIAGIAGSILGGVAGAAASAGGQFAAGSVLLKYSRGAETQADVMGTQVLYDSGFDPRAMAAFFEKLNGQKAPPEFFSDHPNPENRVQRVSEEINKLGGAPPDAQKDSPEFEAIKREVMALPVVNKAKPAASTPPSSAPAPGTVRVAPPSNRYVALDIGVGKLKYPDDWKRYGKPGDLTLAPDGGVVDSGGGQNGLAYGMIASIGSRPDGVPPDRDALQFATEKLIESMQQENANLKITREAQLISINGQRALSTYLCNDSPAGGQENDWLVTILRPDALVYFVFVAPERDFNQFSPAFARILDSVQFNR